MIRCLLYSLVLLAMTLPATAASPLRYRFSLSAKNGGIEGVMVMNREDNDIVGCMFNEFGVSGIDFSYNLNRHSVKLLHVMPFLDKWYIRMVLRRDLKYCVELLTGMPCAPGRRFEISRDDGSTTLSDRQYNLTFTFSPLEETLTEYSDGTEE